jgi:hypothetical protein
MPAGPAHYLTLCPKSIFCHRSMRLIAAERELDPLLHCSKGLTRPSLCAARQLAAAGAGSSNVNELKLPGVKNSRAGPATGDTNPRPRRHNQGRKSIRRSMCVIGRIGRPLPRIRLKAQM